MPLAAHAQCPPAGGAGNALGLLLEHAANRLPELVLLRYGRMVSSPFSFFRGRKPARREVQSAAQAGEHPELCTGSAGSRAGPSGPAPGRERGQRSTGTRRR